MCVKVRKLNGALFTILMLLSCSCCGAFNLDTEFPIIYKGSKGSYFGYTTALHKNRWGYLALVGAPKANTTTFPEPVYEPGTLYRCNITRNTPPGQCQEVFLMQEGAVEENPRYNNAYRDKKDSMWLGVSLDVRPSPNSLTKSENDVITCGHLWKNEYHRQLHLVNGVCYVINGNLEGESVKKLLPLTQRALQYGKDQDGSTEYSHALGQAGMSLAFSEDGSLLVLGAPGIWTWKGSIVIYGWQDYKNNLYRNPIVPHPPQEVQFTSYFGYSVTTGKFFESNKEYIAAGAPKEGYNGKVYIVRQIGNNIRVHQRKQGVQMGEYFGASVLGVNLNGDSFTDLLVGAPQYSLESGGDEGKVYVYISNGKDLQKYTELIGDRKENARFGTALANIGDLNQDGFSDIAVGAPYEDKKGAVYIYHGSRSGVKTYYAQKIEASPLNSRLSGFGIHISRGMDIDDNGYPDILVGSYASSNAVLLRSRPIIHVFPELTFTPKRINMNQTTCDVNNTTLTCVRVDACLWYTGKHVPALLEFHFSASIQDPARRGFFTEKRSRKTGLIMILDIDTKICSQFQLYLNEDVKDVITPIPVQFSHKLISPAGFEKRFNETFPIYHPSILTNITSEIPFHTGCGKDDECHADLVVSATRIEPDEDRLITLGKFPTTTIQITVINVKEPAYLSELLIDLPAELPSIKCDYFSNVSNQDRLITLGKFPTTTIQITVINVKEPAYLSELLIDLPAELPSIKCDYFSNVSNQDRLITLGKFPTTTIQMTIINVKEPAYVSELLIDLPAELPSIKCDYFSNVSNQDIMITLGKSPTITIQITVKNVKEPAYLSELLIDLPAELPSIKYDYFCDIGNQQNNASLVCNLGNPLRNGTQVDINIKLDATKIPPHTKYLEIVCRALTLSTESNPDDNVEVVPLHLETKADIGIIGVSSDNQIMYDEKEAISPIVSHTYTIRNHGPSPLENVNILLNIPYMFLTSIGKKQFVSISALEKDTGTRLSIPAVCDDEFLNLENVQTSLKYSAKGDNDLLLDDKENSSGLFTSKDSVGVPSDVIRRSDVPPKDLTEKENIANNSSSSKARGFIAINCDREDIECISLRCYAAAFTNPRKFAQISVSFQLNFAVIDEHLGSWYQAEFVTTGYISVNDPTVVQIHDHPNYFEVKTMVLHEGPPPSEELAAWIIFVSVGVGVLLLIIILIILIKIGFFRRKEKDIMKEMLCDTNKGEENPQEIDDSDVLPQ